MSPQVSGLFGRLLANLKLLPTENSAGPIGVSNEIVAPIPCLKSLNRI